jgi:hypothetical protein
MEKTTSFLRMLAALFSATAAGLLLAQRIKESVRQAEAEIKNEDRAVDGLAKLQDLMDKAVKDAS